ncbi:MAG: class II fructose-bisphosphate aldolase [Actinobacteria bacterium]|nr:class II fructose-bisphosphate aldolase [Actinomycetota bacterium]
MAHVTLKEILKDARDRQYGIPCLCGADIEMMMGIIKAAEEKQSPLILNYNKQLSSGIPLEIMLPVIVKEAEKAKVPIATMLDHGSDFELIMKAIHYGAKAVMFDGSGLAFEENINRTSEVVKVAHSLGVSVEAELGGVGGNVFEIAGTSVTESSFTNLNEAVEFARRTDVDCLAVSFGNVHGKYKSTPDLDLQLVKRLSYSLDIPLAMHGASGLNFSDYKLIIEAGISKINYFSAMCLPYFEEIDKMIKESNEEAFCVKTIPMTINFWYEQTKPVLDVLMCSWKAGNFTRL